MGHRWKIRRLGLVDVGPIHGGEPASSNITSFSRRLYVHVYNVYIHQVFSRVRCRRKFSSSALRSLSSTRRSSTCSTLATVVEMLPIRPRFDGLRLLQFVHLSLCRLRNWGTTSHDILLLRRTQTQCRLHSDYYILLSRSIWMANLYAVRPVQ